jgi:hypothetical protein
MPGSFSPILECLLARVELAQAVYSADFLFREKAGAHLEFVVTAHDHA